MKQIQIPEQLFMELVKFHLLDMEENTVEHLLSVIEKAARIWADQKGGYAHKYKRKSEK